MLLVLLTVSVVANARTVDGTESTNMRQNFKIKLVGTVIESDPRDSAAVIETGPDGKQRSYHEGEHIVEVLIIEVLLARVIVETEQEEDIINLSRSLTLSQPLTAKSERSGANQSPVPVVSRTGPSNSRRNQTVYLDGKALITELGNVDDKIKLSVSIP